MQLKLKEYVSDQFEFFRSIERFQSYGTFYTQKLDPYFDRGSKKCEICIIFIIWRPIYNRYHILINIKRYFSVNVI